MAIDPSISLGLNNNNIDPNMLNNYAMNNMKLGQMAQGMQATQQQISASQASQANTEAALPGIQATSAANQRTNDFVTKWLPINQGRFTNPDGSVDSLGLTAAATAAGYGDAAQPIAARDIEMAGAAIKNVTSQQEQNIAKATFMNTAAGHLANLVSDPALSDSDATTMLNKGITYANSQVPGSGSQLSQLLTKTVPVKDSKGNPVYQTDSTGSQVLDDNNKPIPLTTQTVDRTAATEVARATQDMNTQFQNAQAKQRQDAALELTSQSPEGHSTTGPQVNAAYSALRAAGIGPDKVPNGMSLFDMKQAYGPVYGDIIGKAVVNNQVTPQTREAYYSQYVAAQKDVATINTALNQVQSMPETMLGTRPGAIVGGAFNKWLSANPQYAALGTAVQAHNNSYPNDQIDPGVLNIQQIQAKLQVDKTNRTNDSTINYNASGQQTLPGAGGGTGGNVPSPSRMQPNQPTGNNTVTQAHVADYAKRNNIPITQVLKMMSDKHIQVTP